MSQIKKNTIRKNKYSLMGRLTVALTGVFVFFTVQGIKPYQKEGLNIYTVYLNGEKVGRVEKQEDADALLREARRILAGRSEELVFAKADLTFESEEIIFGKMDLQDDVERNMLEVLRKNVLETGKRAYTVKINENTVNLRTSEEVIELLNAAKNRYDTKDEHVVQLELDPNRELNVLTAAVERRDRLPEENETSAQAGVADVLSDILERAGASAENELGLKEIHFADTVEVVEAYLEPEEVTSFEDAVAEITREKEKEKIYEVQPGDTLSQIAQKNETTMEHLISINEAIEDENSIIRAGDEITVTMPEPELSVMRTEQMYYEENYEADVQYVDNDDWYTTDMQTLQDPVAGYRKVVADVTYRNDRETERTILQQEIVANAVPRVVERGTKEPPTYIRPISGGRLSSPFGRRSAPKRGASTYHKGIDLATPVGTAVAASSGGTVTRAGWGSGYGYVVYIDHEDGKQTRYGHLSKVLVKTGQTVKQGDKIALSGNTGRSTGPHLHFEILVNGSAVNPFEYFN
ncbi:M23 family metallopeptidase [bacterium C-53]|nr:M23 family metallopeptidase [Lachnospiraceae bacterium]NBI03141.1 M23 family metallopeptidase [Lachnospiraceae bacterium]RKJ10035.1 M23 family metallopeptidase [bacterium C-53]